MTLPVLMLSPSKSRNRAGDTLAPIAQSGGVTIQQGQYEKAWVVPRATTNLFTNPRLGTSATGWTRFASTGSTIVGTRVDTQPDMGPWVWETELTVLAFPSHTQSRYFMASMTGITGAVSGRVLAKASRDLVGASCHLRVGYSDGYVDASPKPITLTTKPQWITYDNAAIDPARTLSYVSFFITTTAVGQVGDKVWMTKGQIENGAYSTVYADGSMGEGHAWTGTPDASTSTRASAHLAFSHVHTAKGTMAVLLKTGPAQVADYAVTHSGGAVVGQYFTNKAFLGGYGGHVTANYGPAMPLYTPMVLGVEWENGKYRTYVNGVINQAAEAWVNATTVPTIGATSSVTFSASAFEYVESVLFFDDLLTASEWGSLNDRRFTWDMLEPKRTPQAHPTRGKTHISAELWRHSLTNEPIEDITPLALSGKVTYNSNAELKGALSLAISDVSRVQPFTDLVAPFLTVTNAAGESQRTQLGLFVIPPSVKENMTPNAARGQLEGRDVLWYLANNGPTSVVNYAGTANVVATVIGIVQAHGLSVSIPASTKTFGTDRTYHPDKSWLQIANDMLTGIGYYTLWAARTGLVKSRPYFELASAEPSLELYSGEGSMVIGSIDRETLGDTLANRVVVYKANPQGSPIIARAVNDDPLSPISTVTLGRDITKRVIEQTIVDQASADAMALRVLEESASNTRKLAITTLPLPDRDLHEVYDLAIYDNDDTARAFGKWWCDQWDMQVAFRPVSASMVHHVKRLEPYGGTLT